MKSKSSQNEFLDGCGFTPIMDPKTCALVRKDILEKCLSVYEYRIQPAGPNKHLKVITDPEAATNANDVAWLADVYPYVSVETVSKQQFKTDLRLQPRFNAVDYHKVKDLITKRCLEINGTAIDVCGSLLRPGQYEISVTFDEAHPETPADAAWIKWVYPEIEIDIRKRYRMLY